MEFEAEFRVEFRVEIHAYRNSILILRAIDNRLNLRCSDKIYKLSSNIFYFGVVCKQQRCNLVGWYAKSLEKFSNIFAIGNVIFILDSLNFLRDILAHKRRFLVIKLLLGANITLDLLFIASCLLFFNNDTLHWTNNIVKQKQQSVFAQLLTCCC